MLSAFLAQLAAGCYLAVSATSLRHVGWKYLRLMAVVCLALNVFAGVFLLREPDRHWEEYQTCTAASLAIAAVLAIVWLFINAAQAPRVANSQRFLPGIAGLVALVGTISLAIGPDPLIPAPEGPLISNPVFSIATTIVLGAVLLGTVTSAMLLGHRYLTDTGMSIKPLMRLARIYLAAIIARSVWVAVAGIPLWSNDFRPHESAMWFWLVVSVRVGAGLIGAAAFAYMTWDCVKRRATQSATALLYLAMVFIFLGELAAQYLMRTEGLAF